MPSPTLNSPSGGGSQLASLSLPGESLRQAALFRADYLRYQAHHCVLSLCQTPKNFLTFQPLAITLCLRSQLEL